MDSSWRLQLSGLRLRKKMYKQVRNHQDCYTIIVIATLILLKHKLKFKPPDFYFPDLHISASSCWNMTVILMSSDPGWS